jgi:hypothetical protein
MTDKQLDRVIDCEAIVALIPDYAFGMTDADETRMVESGLPFCPDATAQLAEFRQLQDEMRDSVPQLEPPPALGMRLFALAVADAPAIPVVPVVPAPPAAPAPVLTQAPAKPKAVPQIAIRPAWIAAAAAVLVLVVTNFYWFTRVNDLTTRYSELANQVSTNQMDTSFVLTSTADLQWVRLPAAQESVPAAAFLMWNRDSEIGVLYASNFPTLEPDHVYQLWLTRGDERISAGTFTVDHYGKGALLFHASVPIDEYTWARVTAEPVAGSEQPGTAVITAGEL